MNFQIGLVRHLRSRAKSVAAIALFVAGGIAYAQNEPPTIPPGQLPGTAIGFSPNNQLKLVVAMGGDIVGPPIRKVSGTNANFSLNAGFQQKVVGDPPTSPPEYTHQSVKKVKIWIGSDYLGEYGPAATDSIAKTIRFASTHFDHGTTQRVIVQATGSGWFEDPNSADDFLVTAYHDVVIWNKGFPLTTKVGWDDVNFDPGQWRIDATLLEPTMAKAAVSAAMTALTGMKHLVDPATADASQNLAEPDCINRFKTSTVFHAVTHGFGSGFSDSFQAVMPFSTVDGYVNIDRGDVPLYNLVVLMACNGVTMGNWDASYTPFGIRNAYDPGGLSVDKCMLTWGAALGSNANLVGGENRLATWTSTFYEQVAKGFTAERAEVLTWWTYKKFTYTASGGIVRPVIHGDKKTKLIGFYESSEGETTWFRVQ